MPCSATDTAYDEAADWLSANFPECSSGLLFNAGAEERRALLPVGRRVLDCFLHKIGHQRSRLHQGLEALAEVSFDFLLRQARFRKTGSYEPRTAARVIREIYHNREKMEGSYLDGLLLTYAFWPNHARMLHCYVALLGSGQPSGPAVLEIGLGHGLMALTALVLLRSARYTAVDVSPHSLTYAYDLLEKNGIEREALCGIVGNAEEPELWSDRLSGSAPWDVVVCGEVLEHVQWPDLLLARMQSALRPEGRAFVTTCANIEAEDHVFRFESVDHIRRTLNAAGFVVRDEQVLPLRGFEEDPLVPLNYAAVLTKAQKEH